MASAFPTMSECLGFEIRCVKLSSRQKPILSIHTMYTYLNGVKRVVAVRIVINLKHVCLCGNSVGLLNCTFEIK